MLLLDERLYRRLEAVRAAAGAALALLVCALLAEAAYLALWPVGFALTHGPQFTYEYLVQYTPIWLRQHRLLEALYTLFPYEQQTLELAVGLLLLVFAWAFVAYLLAFAAVRRARVGAPLLLAITLGGTLVFQATLFLMPPTFTTDLFSYVAYGHIAGVYGLNPYVIPPMYVPGLRVVAWIPEIWQDATSVYGPVWVDLSARLGSLGSSLSTVDRVLIYRLVANLIQVVNLGLFWLLLGRLRPTPGRAVTSARVAGFLLFAWNPLVLFEFAGNGHNDVLMIAFLLLALLFLPTGRPERVRSAGTAGGPSPFAVLAMHPATAPRPAFFLRPRLVLGTLALALSCLVKYTPALLFPLYLAVWARQYTGPLRRLAVYGAGAALALGLAALLYQPWYRGPETFAPIVNWSSGPMYFNHAPDLLARQLADRVLDPAQRQPEQALDQARLAMKVLTRALFLAFCFWQFRRVRTARDLVAAGAAILLVFLVLVHTWVLPWYLTWPLALALLLGWDHVLAKVMVGMSFTGLTMMYVHHYFDWTMPHAFYLYYLAPLLGFVPGLVERLRARRAAPALQPAAGPRARPQALRPEPEP